MPDLVDRVKQDIDARLKELRPLVQEAKQLEEALKALGWQDNQTHTARARHPRRSRSRRRRISREEAGKRRDQVLAILAEDPDTTPSALASMFETSSSNMHQLLSRLQRDGALQRKDGRYRVRRRPKGR